MTKFKPGSYYEVMSDPYGGLQILKTEPFTQNIGQIDIVLLNPNPYSFGQILQSFQEFFTWDVLQMGNGSILIHINLMSSFHRKNIQIH